MLIQDIMPAKVKSNVRAKLRRSSRKRIILVS